MAHITSSSDVTQSQHHARACHHPPLPIPVRRHPPLPGQPPTRLPTGGPPTSTPGPVTRSGGYGIGRVNPKNGCHPGGRARGISGNFGFSKFAKKCKFPDFRDFRFFGFCKKSTPKKAQKTKIQKIAKTAFFGKTDLPFKLKRYMGGWGPKSGFSDRFRDPPKTPHFWGHRWGTRNSEIRKKPEKSAHFFGYLITLPFGTNVLGGDFRTFRK